MLHYVTTAQHSYTIWGFIWGAGWRRVPFLRPLTYEQLFHSRRAPIGHYIFTDFDRLSAYELHTAAHLARQLTARDSRVRIFNDFRRGRQERRAAGAGLGLSICRRIVTRHGGEIGVEPVADGGNRFFFTIPN